MGEPARNDDKSVYGKPAARGAYPDDLAARKWLRERVVDLRARGVSWQNVALQVGKCERQLREQYGEVARVFGPAPEPSPPAVERRRRGRGVVTGSPAMTVPSGHNAVMARRVSGVDELDYFPTPPWAARAGGELIGLIDPGRWTCWEPACGEGHMAHGLSDYFAEVIASDIHPYTDGQCVVDFLAPIVSSADVDWIVTNPPFILGEAFVRVGMKRARRGVAMLLRLAFLEGAGRWSLLHGDVRLSVCAPFAERVPMVKGRWDPAASSATAYAWFVGRKDETGPTRLLSIPPGTRARLSRPDDAARFGVAADAPLLVGL